MAIGAWAIWRSRCEIVFNKIIHYVSHILQITLTNVWGYFKRSKENFHELFHNFSSHVSTSLFCDPSYTNCKFLYGKRFVIDDGRDWMILATATSDLKETSLEAEFDTVKSSSSSHQIWKMQPMPLAVPFQLRSTKVSRGHC